MIKLFWKVLAVWTVVLLTSCGGGGDSSVSKVICKNFNCDRLDPAVGTFVQTDNNMQVKVEDGPRGFNSGPNTNALYATVKVCKPDTIDPSSKTDCQVIDKVLVDTGSVGLRIFAEPVKHLGLRSSSFIPDTWECYPFVVGGLWGQVVTADVWMGSLKSKLPLTVQLIEDDTKSALFKAPDPCNEWANSELYASPESMLANGILGIGSYNIDCGKRCLNANNYIGNAVQYYSCPSGAASSAACVPGELGYSDQVSNPVSALPAPYNKGFALSMPAVRDPGAASATGELIFGVDTIAGSNLLSNNTAPANKKVYLGVDQNSDSYLNITTKLINGRTYLNSYLDTGTNYLRFTDDSIPLCLSDAIAYCPTVAKTLTATISDGSDHPVNPSIDVSFQIGNSDDFSVTKNTAFGSLAAAVNTVDLSNKVVKDYTTFAWGMPFFYGKKVYVSIWEIDRLPTAITDPVTQVTTYVIIDPPWYAWTGI